MALRPFSAKRRATSESSGTCNAAPGMRFSEMSMDKPTTRNACWRTTSSASSVTWDTLPCRSDTHDGNVAMRVADVMMDARGARCVLGASAGVRIGVRGCGRSAFRWSPSRTAVQAAVARSAPPLHVLRKDAHTERSKSKRHSGRAQPLHQDPGCKQPTSVGTSSQCHFLRGGVAAQRACSHTE